MAQQVSNRIGPEQLDLFRPRPQVPIWEDLPKGHREEITKVLGTMLRSYRDRQEGTPDDE